MINQVLACPKCGNMVRVIPPDDWKLDDETIPAIPAVKVNHPKQEKTDAASSDFSNFDDIDDVIANESTPSAPQKPAATKKPIAPVIPEPPRKSRKSAKPNADPQPPESAPNPTDSDAPILPDQNWTSSETKQRQKLIMAIVAGIGILLLTIGGITAFVVNSGQGETAKKTPVENTNDVVDDDTDSELNDPDKDDLDDSASPNPDTQTNPEVKPSDPDKNPDTDTDDPNVTDPKNPIGGGTPLVDDTPPGPNPQRETETPLVENPINEEQEDWKDPLADLDGNNQITDPLLGNSIDSATKISTRVGELNDLLATSGMSLSSIRDVADSEQNLNMGMSKYFIEPPIEPQVRLDMNLANQLSGIQYNNIELDTFLNEIGNLTGVPLSLHVESLRAAGVDLDSKVNMLQTDVEVAEAIDLAIDPLALKKEVFLEANQIVLVAKGWDQLVEKNFQTHQLSDNTPEGQANLVRKIRGMFAEKAWTDESVIKFENKELVVKQVPQVLHQIERLLEKLKAAQTLNSDPTDARAKAILKTEWRCSEEARKNNLNFEPTVDVRLPRFTEQIEKQTQVKILIDWNSLSQLGWWPSTMVPGEFDEPNLQDALRQLTRSLGCTYRALDEKTFEILSINEAYNRPELQVYPVKTIIDKVLTPELLLDTLRQTFVRDAHLVKVHYDADSQSVIVVAPQSIQIQFEAVVDRIRDGG